MFTRDSVTTKLFLHVLACSVLRISRGLSFCFCFFIFVFSSFYPLSQKVTLNSFTQNEKLSISWNCSLVWKRRTPSVACMYRRNQYQGIKSLQRSPLLGEALFGDHFIFIFVLISGIFTYWGLHVLPRSLNFQDFTRFKCSFCFIFVSHFFPSPNRWHLLCKKWKTVNYTKTISLFVCAQEPMQHLCNIVQWDLCNICALKDLEKSFCMGRERWCP